MIIESVWARQEIIEAIGMEGMKARVKGAMIRDSGDILEAMRARHEIKEGMGVR